MSCDPLTPVVMDLGQSLIIPPLFDGTNYAYWKVHMQAFLQSLVEREWLAIDVGWTKPIESIAHWDDRKIKVANFNSRALNALFSVVTNEEYKKTSLLILPRKPRQSYRLLMTKPKLLKTKSFKG